MAIKYFINSFNISLSNGEVHITGVEDLSDNLDEAITIFNERRKIYDDVVLVKKVVVGNEVQSAKILRLKASATGWAVTPIKPKNDYEPDGCGTQHLVDGQEVVFKTFDDVPRLGKVRKNFERGRPGFYVEPLADPGFLIPKCSILSIWDEPEVLEEFKISNP